MIYDLNIIRREKESERLKTSYDAENSKKEI